ncbi:MAG TPA: serine hydrolase domain-containing protein [Woeseiaceae bacterium]|nr:serine hydrolase domain-containing protein [Woeseiaceae bacterium]
MSRAPVPGGGLSLAALACMLLAALAGSGCTERAAAPNRSQQVDALFAPLRSGVQPGAAVMVIKDGEVVHRAGYGYANLDALEPMQADTMVRLASVSKQFTAMAIMVLAEQGALRYDDPVSRYLPELSAYPGVTVRHLLTHTGGLPDYYDTIDTGTSLPTNADALRLLGEMAAPVFPPGERFEYSNPGYDMLAPLVEAASGMEFAAFMKERVFAPAGMTHALIHDHRPPVIAHRALGYEPEGGDFVLDDFDPLNGIVGSGGMYASLEDFLAWDEALYGSSLVSRETIDKAFTAMRLNDGSTTDYGFGWRIDDYRGQRRLRHGGSWVGFRTHIARIPAHRFTIVILSNRGDFQPETYIDPISDIYLGAATP